MNATANAAPDSLEESKNFARAEFVDKESVSNTSDKVGRLYETYLVSEHQSESRNVALDIPYILMDKMLGTFVFQFMH